MRPAGTAASSSTRTARSSPSNFPIEKLWTSYADLLAVFRAAIGRYSGSEQAQILHDVATDVYHLPT